MVASLMRRTPYYLSLVAALSLALPALGCGASQKSEPKTERIKHRPEKGQFPWMKEPGPIGGKWRPSCPRMEGTVIEIVVDGEHATGRIARVGRSESYGYTQGEEIFKLEGHYLGKWVGEVKKRTVLGDSRWEPIQFEVENDLLDAVVTNDECWRQMAKAP